MFYDPEQFVDREAELAAFEKRLQGLNPSSVLFYHGPAGWGKTSMLYRVRDACRAASTTCALVDFSAQGLLDIEAVITRMRVELRGDFYRAVGEAAAVIDQTLPAVSPADLAHAALQDALPAQWTIPGSPLAPIPPGTSVEGQISNLAEGSIAAVGVGITQTRITIHNANFVTPESEMKLRRKERAQRLSLATLSALEALAALKKVVLLFDACDEAAEGIAPWLRENLLVPLVDGSFPNPANLSIVLVGDPTCPPGAWLNEVLRWGSRAATLPLGKLPYNDVHRYWVEICGLGSETFPPSFRNGAPPGIMVQMANLEKGLRGNIA